MHLFVSVIPLKNLIHANYILHDKILLLLNGCQLIKILINAYMLNLFMCKIKSLTLGYTVDMHSVRCIYSSSI